MKNNIILELHLEGKQCMYPGFFSNFSYGSKKYVLILDSINDKKMNSNPIKMGLTKCSYEQSI